ncbi:MAG: hypothetical protein HC817_13925 [Saprospiraceae bacterium]|nr:hypothetical protein [Saprospiraceae bacterium]
MRDWLSSFVGNFSKYQWWLIAGLILYGVKTVNHTHGDFSIYFSAATALRWGQPVYFTEFLIDRGMKGSYSYSPFFALFFINFYLFPAFFGSIFLWLVAQIFFSFSHFSAYKFFY